MAAGRPKMFMPVCEGVVMERRRTGDMQDCVTERKRMEGKTMSKEGVTTMAEERASKQH